MLEIFQRALAQTPGKDGIRRSRWAVIRNTYPQLKDTTIRTFQQWFPPERCGKYNISTHDYILQIGDVCAEILFRALDRPDQVANLLSLELTGAWLNEFKEIPFAVFEAIQGRVDRYPAKKDGGCTWTGIIMDSNPPDTDSKYYHYFEETSPDNARLFKQPSGLSPQAENLDNLSGSYYGNLASGKSQDFIDVYVHGKYGYVKEGKGVYDGSYNDDIHVSKEPLTVNTAIPLILGFDFGLTPACVLCQVTPRGGFNVLEELISDNMGLKQFIQNRLKPQLL
ncbi:TerL, partial [Candidatus Magnetobacterium bavaricum]